MLGVSRVEHKGSSGEHEKEISNLLIGTSSTAELQAMLWQASQTIDIFITKISFEGPKGFGSIRFFNKLNADKAIEMVRRCHEAGVFRRRQAALFGPKR